jgi:hypothetical protein
MKTKREKGFVCGVDKGSDEERKRVCMCVWVRTGVEMERNRNRQLEHGQKWREKDEGLCVC